VNYVLRTKYLHRHEDGTYETIPEFHERVAKGVAGGNDYLERQVYQLLSARKALFGGRVLAAACIAHDDKHANALTMLNCFSLDIEDSLESILEVHRKAAIILASGGGVGYNFSKIRPRGSKASHRDGIASGPCSFMLMYDAMMQTIQQGGARRGAAMGILQVDHPDIYEFLDLKKEEGRLTAFNISVGVTNEFLTAVENDDDWDLIFNGEVKETVKARKLFKDIATSAHRNGEPGVLYFDNIEAKNPTPHLGPLRITNPCSEALLYNGESCCLGSLNLVEFLTEDRQHFNWPELREAIHIMVEALDSILDQTYYPLENEQCSFLRDVALETRKIGLGVVGWHDVLIYQGIQYDSKEALELADTLFGFINKEAAKASIALSEELGPYPACQEETPIRNATRTCIAPTGSLAIVLGVSHSIEPYFSLLYKKALFAAATEETDEIYTVINPLQVIAEENDYWGQKGKWFKAIDDFDTPTIESIIPDNILNLFKGATQVSAQAHLAMLAKIQEHTDQGVSKTINCSSDTTVEEIEQLILDASKMGVKGLTVYRTGSREQEVLTTDSKESIDLTEIIRPPVRDAKIYEVQTKYGALHATISKYRDRLYEMFLTVSRAGSDLSPISEALGRLITLLFKKGVSAEEIQHQLQGVGGQTQIAAVRSLPDGIATVLEMVKTTEQTKTQPSAPTGDICPQCHNISIIKSGGCATCSVCGHSSCG